MATTQEVRFRYTADDRQFRTVSGRVNTNLGKLTRSAAAFTVGALGAASITTAFRGIRNQISSTLTAFKAQEDAAAGLNAALIATGKGGTAAFKTLADEAKRLQQVTTAGDEALLQATATLAQLVPSLDVAGLRDAQQAIVGFADTFVGGDLNNAALLLGKTLGSTTNALTRYGISISDTAAPATEKLAELLGNQTLAAAFSVSEAKAKTFSGQMQQLANATGDLREELGEVIVKVLLLSDSIDAGKANIEQLTATVEANKQDWIEWGQQVTLGSAVFATAVLAMIRTVSNLVTSFVSLVGAADALGRFDLTEARRQLSLIGDDMDDVTSAWELLDTVGNKFADSLNDKITPAFTESHASILAVASALNLLKEGLRIDTSGAGDTGPLEGLEKVMERLSTKLAVSRGEFELWGDTSKRVKSDVSAFTAAITSLLGLGLSADSSVIVALNEQLNNVNVTALANLRAELVGLDERLVAAGPAGEALALAMQNVGAAATIAGAEIELAAEAISDWQVATNRIVDSASFFIVDAATDWKNAFKSFADFAISELGRVLAKLALFRFLQFAFAGSTGGIGGAILTAVSSAPTTSTAGGGVTLDFSKAPPATNPAASMRDTELQKWVVGTLKNANAQGIR